MKKLLAPIAISTLVFAAVATADMTRTETSSSSSTTYSGTISDLSPSSSSITIRSQGAAEPKVYSFTDKTTWVDQSGHVVTMEQARNQPVTVYYNQDGDRMLISKVIVQKAPSARVTEEKTTTTHVAE